MTHQCGYLPQASAYRTVALGWENPVPQRVPVKGPSGGSIKQKTARAGAGKGTGVRDSVVVHVYIRR